MRTFSTSSNAVVGIGLADGSSALAIAEAPVSLKADGGVHLGERVEVVAVAVDAQAVASGLSLVARVC